MTQSAASLKMLQRLDDDIKRARERVHGYEPRIEEVELPVLELEAELGRVGARLAELGQEERRLERSVERHRELRRRLDDRTALVRNLREEAAVISELEMVRRALNNDEQESMAVLDQIRRLEGRSNVLQEQLAHERVLVDPQKEALLREQEEAREALGVLGDRRVQVAGAMDDALRKLYEGVSRDGRRAAVAELDDGACGHCYAVVPVQQRNQIAAGITVQCEPCGVILTSPDEDA